MEISTKVISDRWHGVQPQSKSMHGNGGKRKLTGWSKICGLSKGSKHDLSYSVIYYIYIPGTLGPWSDTLWPLGRVRLFADCTISLSSLCRLICICRHWTTKMLVRYMLPSVCLRLRQLSQLSFIRYMGLCVFSLPNSPVMIVRICTLSIIIIIKSEVWILNHCLEFGYGMRCMSYYVLMILQKSLSLVVRWYHLFLKRKGPYDHPRSPASSVVVIVRMTNTDAAAITEQPP